MSEGHVNSGGGLSTSETLLGRVQGDKPDPAAWKSFFDIYAPLINGWCRNQGLQPADADDVTQDVFRLVYTKIGKFEHGKDGGTLRGWLRRITSNCVTDMWRMKQKQPDAHGGSDALRLIQEAPDPSPEDATQGTLTRDEERGILRRTVLDSLSTFEEKTKEIFCRVVLEKQSPAHVAQDLHVTLDVVYTSKSRVLKKLKQDYGILIDFKKD